MDELEISGKRYISTRRAAREHGYHSDYMGQLIRGKKVEGQKVGRAWYIDEASLAIYLGKATQPEQQVPPAQPERLEQQVRLEQPVQPKQLEQPVRLEQPERPEQLKPETEIILEQEVAPIVQPAPVQYVEPEKKPEMVWAPVERVEPVQPAAVEVLRTQTVEENTTRIPIHIPAHAIQDIGGLRYSADDSPSLPTVVRMPRQQQVQPVQLERQVQLGQETRGFPVVSLSIIGIATLMAAAFASNFISTTISSEPGKSAVVQYAIHW